MSNSKERILWIDVAKGICILAVIAGHLGIAIIDKYVYSFHLGCFFILSGYTLKNDLNSETINKKFKRLMIPYFVTCIAIILMESFKLIKNNAGNVFTLSDRFYSNILRTFFASGASTNLGHINYGTRIGAIWFLPALFFAILITQLIIKHISNRKVQMISSASIALIGILSAKFIWLPFSIQSAMLAVPFILFGYYAKNYNLIEKFNFKHLVVCLALFFAGGGYISTYSIWFVNAYLPDLIITPICVITSSLSILYISKKIQFFKPLAWIGQNSIYFLCIHLFQLETCMLYFSKILNLFNIKYNAYLVLLMMIVSTYIATYLLLLLKKLVKKSNIKASPAVELNPKRDESLDLSKAMLIILMIVGHFSLSYGFRKFIYSFHMMAFVFFSGYLFNPKSCNNIFKSILNLIKHFLLPYFIFGLIYIIHNPASTLVDIKTLLYGISFSRKYFTSISSIGPIYFVLMLFITRLIYLIISKFIKNEPLKSSIIFLLTLLGFKLGKSGYWLPWSLDCALYSLIFYHLGYFFKKYNLLKIISSQFYTYFILSIIWAYMIYSGSMEIAIRNYGNFGLTILGAISATILLYMLSNFIKNHSCKFIKYLLCLIGKSTFYILIIHTLFGNDINSLVSSFGFTYNYFYHFTLAIFLNLLFGVMIHIIIESIKNLQKNILQKTQLQSQL